MRKIGSFISAIITIIIAVLVGYLCYQLNLSNAGMEGVQKLSLIVTLPIAIIFYVLLFGLIVSSVITSSLLLSLFCSLANSLKEFFVLRG
jgi:ABC-type nitrate/sulfonate/bicarbonate transport system permease component